MITLTPFADKNEFRFRVSVAENNGVPRAVKFAARALAKVFANLEQRIVRDLVNGFKKRRPCRHRQRQL